MLVFREIGWSRISVSNLTPFISVFLLGRYRIGVTSYLIEDLMEDLIGSGPKGQGRQQRSYKKGRPVEGGTCRAAGGFERAAEP